MVPTYIQIILLALSLVFFGGAIIAYIERELETSFYVAVITIFLSLFTAHVFDTERQHKSFDQIYHGTHRVDLVEYMITHEGDTVDRVYKLVEVTNMPTSDSDSTLLDDEETRWQNGQNKTRVISSPTNTKSK